MVLQYVTSGLRVCAVVSMQWYGRYFTYGVQLYESFFFFLLDLRMYMFKDAMFRNQIMVEINSLNSAKCS
jgi:hypothetical protein